MFDQKATRNAASTQKHHSTPQKDSKEYDEPVDCFQVHSGKSTAGVTSTFPIPCIVVVSKISRATDAGAAMLSLSRKTRVQGTLTLLLESRAAKDTCCLHR